MIRRSLPLTVLLLLVTVAVGAVERPPVVPPSARDLERDVRMLADPSMEGRAPGTPGGERAAQEIARILGAAGLKPGGDGSSFFQSFTYGTGTRIAPLTRFELLAPDASQLDIDREWRPHGGSLHGE